MKKHSERRKHSVLAVVRRTQKVSPRRRPLPVGAGLRDDKNLISPPFTYRPSLVKIDAHILSYRGNRPIHKHRPPACHRQDR